MGSAEFAAWEHGGRSPAGVSGGCRRGRPASGGWDFWLYYLFCVYALATSNLCELVSEMDGINDAWIVWKNSFLRAVADYVPMKKVKTKGNVPWLTSEIRHLLKIKETVRGKLARYPSHYTQEKFKCFRAQAKQALKVSRKQNYDYLEKIICAHPKRFLKLFKLSSRTSNTPQSVLWKTENDQKVANNTISIAELLNSYFTSIFTNHLHNHEMKNTDTADFNEPPPQILN